MRRRRTALFLIIGAAIPLTVASTAWACANLATLKANSVAAAAGAEVTLTGVNYSGNTNQPVSIRMDSRTAPELVSVLPNSGGRISTNVTIPGTAKPGYHVLLATQNTPAGSPKSGTPGRTTIRVQGVARRSSEAPPASPWSNSSNPSGGSNAAVAVDAGPGTLPTLAGIGLSLALLGTGLTFVARRRATPAKRSLLGA